MKARLKKKRFFKRIDENGVETVDYEPFSDESPYSFSLSKKQLLIFGAVFLVAGLSAWLRVTGIVDIFKVSVETAVIFVGSFIFAEIAIANVFVSDTTRLRDKFVEMSVLFVIQVVLLGLSFILEFSSLSNKLAIAKNENTFVIDKERALNEQKQALNEQLQLVKSEYANLPENRLSLRQKTLKSIDDINQQKISVQGKIDELYKDKSNAEQKINGVTLEHTADLLGVPEKTLTKYMMITIAGILNILYIMLLYAGLKEGQEYDE